MRPKRYAFTVFVSLVSIHASVKDATILINNSSINSSVSIHASVKDATDGEGISVDFTQVSIHASVKDATMIGS